jgi:hypothetical protein
MSNLFKQFKTDPKKEQDGIAIQYGANDDGTIPSFRVRRRGASNQQYAKVLTRETMPYRRQIELNALDEMVSRAILMKVFCMAVLVGWDNVQDESGKVIAFNTENAVMLFNLLPDLYDDLVLQSGKLELFRSDEVEQAAKN